MSTGEVSPSPELEQYIDDLQKYLDENGVQFFDFNGDPDVLPEFYLDGDHIDPAYKKAYTEIFRDRLKEFLASPDA